jgi:protein TonB
VTKPLPELRSGPDKSGIGDPTPASLEPELAPPRKAPDPETAVPPAPPAESALPELELVKPPPPLPRGPDTLPMPSLPPIEASIEPPRPPPPPPPPKPRPPRDKPTLASRMPAPHQGKVAAEGRGDAYLNLVRALIAQHDEELESSVPHGADGMVVYSVMIDRDGAVREVRLDHSSGNMVLDRELGAIIRRVSPFPPPPPDRLIDGAMTFEVVMSRP